MKVKHHSDDYLILSDIPWALSLLMIGMVLVFVFAGLQIIDDGDLWEGAALAVFGGGFAMLFVYFFARRSQVVFDRAQGQVFRRSRSFLRYEQDIWPISDVERAIVEKMSDTDGDTFRPTLLMSKGERRVPLISTFGGETYAENAVEAINTWLGALDTEHNAP